MKVVGSELDILLSHVIWRTLGKPCKKKEAVRTDYCWLTFRAGLSDTKQGMLMLLNLARDKGYKYFVRMELAYRKNTQAKTRNSYVGMLRDAAIVSYCVCVVSHDNCQLLCLCCVS